MAQAFEGALVALQRVAEERAADCADEVARHRSWLLNCVSETKALLAEQRAGTAPALQAKRARVKKGAQETAGKENSDDAAERPSRGRRGRPQPDTANVDAEPVVCEPAAPAQTGVAERSDPQANVDAVAAEAEPVVDMACDNAVLAAAAAPASEAAQEQLLLRQLSAAAAVPLPSLPAKPPANALAPPRASPPAAADRSPASQMNAIQVDSQAPAGDAPPVVKQSGKILALQAAELARKQEQRIHDERQAKKAELERQREAARRTAMQQPPSVPCAAADVSAMPPPASSAALPAPGKSAAPVLPARLQQAMQAHQQLTEAHRRDAEEKLLLAEEAKRKVEESNARAEELHVAASRLPIAAASVVPQAPAAAVAAPVIVPAAPPTLPKTVAAPVAAIHAAAPPQAAPTPLPAVVALAELQSYEISPYKSGSDSDEEAAERPRKPVPAWARSDALAPVLYAQAKADPDAIFQNPSKTCSLDEVFQCAGNKKRDFSRRGSSGNWTEDQLTWKEEMSFKRRMGYATGMSEATPRSAQGGSRT